ncbi:MAG TPA: hypothetical protein VK524_12015, partial [Polyangiaceae bacterium]|nr:hypothetical protein [Polyangiaceae bacterium]
LCALSMAAVLAADHKRVLVVDTDVYAAAKRKAARVPGFGNVLNGECELQDVVRSVQVPFGEFQRVTAGTVPAHAGELFSRGNLARVLNEARAHFDFVLLDAQSCPASTDPLLLAAESDLVLSVIRLRRTPREFVEGHLRAVSTWGRRCAIVLNDVRSASTYPEHPRPRAAARRSLTPLRVIHPYTP